MKYKIAIQDIAKLDILEAAKYYNLKQPGLGKRFLTSFRNKVNYIHSNPEGYAIRYKDVRMAVLETFPYVIHFQIDNLNKTISILAVFYGGENPQKWE